MLPPVLEIYVVWHPGDTEASRVASRIVDHFHGTAFSGLIGGAIEVYPRSAGWSRPDDAPRPFPYYDYNPTHPIEQPTYLAIVPVLGIGMAKAVQNGGPWADYVSGIKQAQANHPSQVGVFPYLLHPGATDGSALGDLLGAYQLLATSPGMGIDEDEKLAEICRDLAQGVAQLAQGNKSRLKVFISHTKKGLAGSESYIQELIAAVRDVIANTRLQEFFDASDLQPGSDWDSVLRAEAATSAILALRTDLYPSRAWCQREVLIAKRAGMPVVIMDAIEIGEERGSFLMDHAPRLPIRRDGVAWDKTDIRNGLNILVDECLKRALWNNQQTLAQERRANLHVDWWAPHAPEPITIVEKLETWKKTGASRERPMCILHPDPPLGPDELDVLNQLALLAGINLGIDIMTPRLLAARGG